MENNYIVTKANSLINANYNLSLQEQKIILILASMVQPYDEEFQEYKLEIKELLKLLDIKDQSKYIELPKITKELMKKVFEIKEGKEILQLAWLSSARYKTQKGELYIKFSPDLKPYLLKLKSLYTSYKLDNILTLKSKYSIRVYELLKSNEYKNQYECSINDLKKKLYIIEKSYDIYQNFKNRVIIKAQKELKEKTDIEFEFEEIKTGRKVTALKFFIKENEKNKSKHSFKEIENKIDEIKEKKEKNIVKNEEQKEIKIDEFEDKNIKYFYELFEEKISKKNIKKIIENAENDIEKIERIYEYSKTQNIENLVGFMLKMVQGDNFIEPIEGKKSKKETDLRFNDFLQREYDYDNLEMKLLGWDKEKEVDEEPIKQVEQGIFDFKEERTEQEEFEDENIIKKIRSECEEENEIVYRSEIDTVKMFLEDQLTGIFGEVKYKSWLKYGVDNLGIDDRNVVHFDFKNEFSLKIFERDYKDVLLELISSIEPILQLKTSVK
ncbi:replication initiation protein [Clostridium baratii]|uniref:replication initiation protein n=1 Tax=Clostridium baratii TaxID=1561 RepID=UPI0030CBD9A1